MGITIAISQDFLNIPDKYIFIIWISAFNLCNPMSWYDSINVKYREWMNMMSQILYQGWYRGMYGHMYLTSIYLYRVVSEVIKILYHADSL